MEQGLVAYFDVLGFKEMAERNDPKLKTYFLQIEHEAIDQLKHLEIQHLIFSDSVFMKVEFENDRAQLARFLMALRNIQWELARIGIWVKGAVTIGPIQMEKSRSWVVGGAIVETHTMEQKGIMPRIEVSSKILDSICMNKSEFLKVFNSAELFAEKDADMWGKELVHSSDNPADPIFINYVMLSRPDLERSGDIVSQTRELRDKLQEDYRKSRNQKWHLKHRWLWDYAERAARNSSNQELTSLFSSRPCHCQDCL